MLLDELVELLSPMRARWRWTVPSAPAATPRRWPRGSARRACCWRIDRDPSVAEFFREMARAAPCTTELYHGNFADVLAERPDASADIVYMDLGVSSMQLDRRERGFSYAYDAPLDMRMDPELEVTAADLVNTLPDRRADQHLPPLRRGALRREHRARHRARRAPTAPLTTTGELVEVIKRNIPTPARFGAGNPARRVFQALRIVVNDELESLARGLDEAYRCCARAVVWRPSRSTRSRTAWSRSSSRGRPRAASARPACRVCVCGHEPTMRVLTRRPVTARHARGRDQPAQQVGQASRRGQALGGGPWRARQPARRRRHRATTGTARAPRPGRRAARRGRAAAPRCAPGWPRPHRVRRLCSRCSAAGRVALSFAVVQKSLQTGAVTTRSAR